MTVSKTAWKCPLGKVEIGFYFAVWIVHSLLAFYVSIRSTDKLWTWLKHWTQPSEYMNGYYIDMSDIEWKLYRTSLFEMLVSFVIHSVVFQIVIRAFALRRHIGDLILVVFWVVLHIYLTSIKCVLFTSFLIVLTTAITYFTHRQIFAWIICIIFVLKADLLAPYSYEPAKYYREFNLYLYTCIQVINFCVFLCRNPSKKFDSQLLVRYLQYLFYPMYSITLIVLYEDFENQLNVVWRKVEKRENLYDPEINFW